MLTLMVCPIAAAHARTKATLIETFPLSSFVYLMSPNPEPEMALSHNTYSCVTQKSGATNIVDIVYLITIRAIIFQLLETITTVTD